MCNWLQWHWQLTRRLKLVPDSTSSCVELIGDTRQFTLQRYDWRLATSNVKVFNDRNRSTTFFTFDSKQAIVPKHRISHKHPSTIHTGQGTSDRAYSSSIPHKTPDWLWTASHLAVSSCYRSWDWLVSSWWTWLCSLPAWTSSSPLSNSRRRLLQLIPRRRHRPEWRPFCWRRRGSREAASALPGDGWAGNERKERRKLPKKSRLPIPCTNGDATNSVKSFDALTRSFYLQAR